VDNSGARLPELDPVLLSRAFQGVEHSLVGDDGALLRIPEAFHRVEFAGGKFERATRVGSWGMS